MAEGGVGDNHQINRAKLILMEQEEVNYEDSEHTFYLDLPPYSLKDKVVKFMEAEDDDDDWGPGDPPTFSVDFSFSDGNLTGVENSFTLNLGYGKLGQREGNMRLIVQIYAKIKQDSVKVDEKQYWILLKFARISFVNELEDAFLEEFSSEIVRFPGSQLSGFRRGTSGKAYLNWDRDYKGIKVTIKASKRPKTSIDIVLSKPMMDVSNSCKEVNTSFSKYFLTEDLSDFKVVAGDKEFPAHRLALAVTSGFCQQMFSTGWSENKNGVWKIDDFDPAVVEEFLEFMYKGTSKNLALAQNMEFLMNLYRMGHKYDVVQLKTQCAELLKNLINPENVVDLFHFGFLYDSESLMDAAKIYFNKFKLQILPDSDALGDLQEKFPLTIIHKLTIE